MKRIDKLNYNQLTSELISDVSKIFRGLELSDFYLEIKDYSKTYFGYYIPASKQIRIFLYKDKNKKHKRSYINLLLTLIHELVHHYQWCKSDYVRVRGVMHDVEFHRINKKLRKRVVEELFLCKKS